MSTSVKGGSSSSGIHTRILVTGSDLLAGALAGALETRGFATMHIAPSEPDIERGIGWGPDLVLIDVRPFDIDTGSSLIDHFCRQGLQVCVIDAADDDARRAAWLRLGPAEIIDRSEKFDQLFLTITRLLRVGVPPGPGQRSGAPLASAPGDPARQDTHLQLFGTLTDREEVVLSELLEGHCAEEIAKAAFVSISTVRSQIKSILQKLGVNSQLAAVALARRAGWSLDKPKDTPPKPANPRRSRAS
jgi:two-component system, NarL family, nitrate/nitrite response regulator NarL